MTNIPRRTRQARNASAMMPLRRLSVTARALDPRCDLDVGYPRDVRLTRHPSSCQRRPEPLQYRHWVYPSPLHPWQMTVPAPLQKVQDLFPSVTPFTHTPQSDLPLLHRVWRVAPFPSQAGHLEKSHAARPRRSPGTRITVAFIPTSITHPCSNRHLFDAGPVDGAPEIHRMSPMKSDDAAREVARTYDRSRRSLETVRRRLNRPLSLAEKVLLGHLDDPAGQELAPGKAVLRLRVDRVAMQDATAQMAILQFAQARLPRVAVPSTVHCDHLIQARSGAAADLEGALAANREVYDFLSSASRKYGIGFWKPGAGIIHQVVLENYAFPGGLMIGTDSHTPNAGGLGMAAVGVGGADAVDAMAGMPWEVKHPKLIGVRLTGRLGGWTAPKDVILWVCRQLTVKGGTDHVVEYFGPGCASISATGKATICNMGAEHGATTSVFPFDDRMKVYLEATGRESIARLAGENADLLRADEGSEKNYDRVLELDLSTLEPHVTGPHTPDLSRPLSRLKEDVRREGYPDNVTAALVGSCTNASYEDLARAADVARQAAAAGLRMAASLLITPGSDRVFETLRREGILRDLEAVGATVLANACGPCIGQWKRDGLTAGQRNSIVTSFNRNFPARNDGNAETFAFIASPEIVMALGLAGRLSFDPSKDELPGGRRLRPPGPAPEVPPGGFPDAADGFVPPAEDGSSVQVIVDPASPRLQLLEPFAPWDGRDFEDCPVLLKAAGKCTTDHISPAGKWLAFRGHLDRISDNMLTAATNAFTGKPAGEEIPRRAREIKGRGRRWVVVGDWNYGEGSSREHAAMSPRHLGAAAVIARSFARIHETNLKKQGLLPLTFSDASDYERVREGDRISFRGLAALTPGKDIEAALLHADGKAESLRLRHSLTSEQIEWFRAGSALNLLRSKPRG
jgi:aconitate hydratase